MATHSSVLAWRIPGKGEPGRLPSMGLHRVGHDWSNLAAAAAGVLWDSFEKHQIMMIKVPGVAVVQLLSCVQLFVTPWTAAYQALLSLTISWSCPGSWSLSWWYYPTISFSAAPFSFCLKSFPASESFPMSQSAVQIRWPKYWHFSFSSSPSKVYQDWFPLGLIFLISLLSKGLSRVFSSTTDWKHQFFGTQPSLWSNSHIHTWLLERPYLYVYRPFECLCFLIHCLGLSYSSLQGANVF